jgi:hypothetical protein
MTRTRAALAVIVLAVLAVFGGLTYVGTRFPSPPNTCLTDVARCGHAR